MSQRMNGDCSFVIWSAWCLWLTSTTIRLSHRYLTRKFTKHTEYKRQISLTETADYFTFYPSFSSTQRGRLHGRSKQTCVEVVGVYCPVGKRQSHVYET